MSLFNFKPKSEKAVELMRKEGISAYAAAKRIGIDLTTIYKSKSYAKFKQEKSNADQNN
ncbi:MAG: hypothetical protein V4447_10715 [Pseudomonadota bacterium]